jgi:Ankyrin repeats (3 copies)/Domain of unknown function (DUF3471)
MTCSKKWTSASAILATSILCGVLVSSIAYGQASKPAAFEPYLGSYELAPGAILTISREGDSLYAQTTGQPKHRLAAISEHRFSDAVSRAELHFALGGDGRAVSVTQHLDGAARVAKRTEAAGTQAEAKARGAESNGTAPSTDPAPLADAVLARDLDSVRKLVARGADIHGLDTRPATAGANGRRPLNFAALQNDTAMIELLLELGADIDRQNKTGFTPLHHAVEVQALEAIALLLERGADTTVKNNRGLTPGEFALATNRNRAAKALGVSVQAE